MLVHSHITILATLYHLVWVIITYVLYNNTKTLLIHYTLNSICNIYLSLYLTQISIGSI